MSDQDQSQIRAARLLAMALKAREEGHIDVADRFTQRAAEILEHPTALERLGTQSGEKVIGHPQPKTDGDKEK
jgi:rubrerythrin